MNELTQIEVNGNPAEPVSRGEFAEAMGYVGNAFGRLQQTLYEHGEQFDRLEQRMVRLEKDVGELKQRLDEWGERILASIDVAVENRQVDLGAAKAEHVTLLDEKVDDHERRIGSLEESRHVAQS